MNKNEQILDILKSSPSVALLCARSCNIILEFLTSIFDDETVISQENIYGRLADYLSDQGIEIDDENDVEFSDTYEEKAVKYIKKWTDSGFLTNYQNEDGEIYYELSSHTSKVIDWLSGLQQEEYIGTESKFKSIITQLRELVEYTNEDKEKRIQLLEDKKLEIEQQIQRLKMGEDIKVYEEYEIVPRFHQINKLAKELLSDFKDVENNFKSIIKEIYQRQINPSLKKGEILQYTFDALDELKSSSQGKSFYAFWDFLLAKEMQTELDDLITELFNTLDERSIEENDQFLRNMVTYLYESGRKVYQSNDRMADKLSHIIRENEVSRSDVTKRTIQEIKNVLIEISKTDCKPDISLAIDDDIDINIPFERKLTYEPGDNTEYMWNPEKYALSIEDLGEFGKVLGNFNIDRKKIERNIHSILEEQSQTTITEVIQKHPLKKGLPELFAYFSVLPRFTHTSINEDNPQYIVFDHTQNKRIQIPEIIISR